MDLDDPFIPFKYELCWLLIGSILATIDPTLATSTGAILFFGGLVVGMAIHARDSDSDNT